MPQRGWSAVLGARRWTSGRPALLGKRWSSRCSSSRSTPRARPRRPQVRRQATLYDPDVRLCPSLVPLDAAQTHPCVWTGPIVRRRCVPQQQAQASTGYVATNGPHHRLRQPTQTADSDRRLGPPTRSAVGIAPDTGRARWSKACRQSASAEDPISQTTRQSRGRHTRRWFPTAPPLLALSPSSFPMVQLRLGYGSGLGGLSAVGGRGEDDCQDESGQGEQGAEPDR